MAVSTQIELIPILDLDPLLADEPGAVDDLGTQLRFALEKVGFFFVTNHGVPWTRVGDVYEQAARLHALPLAQLQQIHMDKKHGGWLELGGGTSYASDIAGDVRKPNMNKAYFVHRNGYRMGNQWPDLEGFRAIVDPYMDAVEALAHRLLPVLAASLELPHDWFLPHFDQPSCTLRMSHYPIMDYEDNEWGLAPHTDSSIFTFLPANDVPGLEIRPAGQDWIEPPPVAQSYLINSGDMLKRWTNQRFMSTAHRARNASTTDRYAMPFFFGARDDALVEALPTCVSADRPALHDPIAYGDYQRWFLNRNYAQVTGEQASEVAP